MPDGSGKGGFAGNIEEYGEAVLKPVKDEAGKILETAANSFGASNNRSKLKEMPKMPRKNKL